MFLSVYASVFLLFTVMGTLASNPGTKIKITHKGLQFARKIGVNFLEQKIKEFQLPDETGKKDFWGWVDYKASRIRVTDLGFHNSSAQFIPDIGIKFSNDVYLSLDGVLEVALGPVHSTMAFNLNISTLSVTLIVGFLHNTSQITVIPISCNSTFKDFEIGFQGSGKWLYDRLGEGAKNEIRKTFSKKVCSHFLTSIEHLKAMELNGSYQMNKYVKFDYSLDGDPVITENSIEWPVKGVVYDCQHHNKPSYDVQPFDLPDIIDLMLYIGISENFFNAMGFAYYEAGALQINITDDAIPENLAFRLNTYSLSLLLHEVGEQYPNMLLKIELNATKEPLFTFTQNNFTVDLFAAAKVSVILPDNSSSELFSLHVKTSVNAELYISEMRLRGVMHLKSFDLGLKESKVGDIHVKVLDAILENFFKMSVFPKLNVLLYRGKALPILNNVSLLNPIIKINKVGMVEMESMGNGSTLRLIPAESQQERFELRLNLAGIDPRNVKVTIRGRELDISGQHVRKIQEGEGISRYNYCGFSNELHLPPRLDLSTVAVVIVDDRVITVQAFYHKTDTLLKIQHQDADEIPPKLLPITFEYSSQSVSLMEEPVFWTPCYLPIPGTLCESQQTGLIRVCNHPLPGTFCHNSPGTDPEHVNVVVTGRTLNVSGEQFQKVKDISGISRYNYCGFSNDLPLSPKLDLNTLTATIIDEKIITVEASCYPDHVQVKETAWGGEQSDSTNVPIFLKYTTNYVKGSTKANFVWTPCFVPVPGTRSNGQIVQMATHCHHPIPGTTCPNTSISFNDPLTDPPTLRQTVPPHSQWR